MSSDEKAQVGSNDDDDNDNDDNKSSYDEKFSRKEEENNNNITNVSVSSLATVKKNPNRNERSSCQTNNDHGMKTRSSRLKKHKIDGNNGHSHKKQRSRSNSGMRTNQTSSNDDYNKNSCCRRSKRIFENYTNNTSVTHGNDNNHDPNEKKYYNKRRTTLTRNATRGRKMKRKKTTTSRNDTSHHKSNHDANNVNNIQNNRKRVIVIGAGIAGLAAARELMERDYDVVVVEARNRPGGRLKTVPLQIIEPTNNNNSFKEFHSNGYNNKCQRYSLQHTPLPHSFPSATTTTNNNNGHEDNHNIHTKNYKRKRSHRRRVVCPTDMGGAFVHGVHKNPIFQMVNQMGITARAMNTGNTHTLLLQYDNAGWPVRAEIDGKVQKRFNEILERALYYVQKVLHPPSKKEEERENIKSKKTPSPSNNNNINHHDSQLPLASKILKLTPNTNFGTLFYYLASLGDLKKIQPNIQIQIQTDDGKVPKQEEEEETEGNQYFNDYHKEETFVYSSNKTEQSLFQWHLNNLELSCGTSLNQLGLQWNEDEQFGYNGHHVILREGFGALIEGLIQVSSTKKKINHNEKTIPIQYGVEVSQIRILPSTNTNNNENLSNYTKQQLAMMMMRVQVVTTNGLILQAHHVICTLPLGVLAIPPHESGHIYFDPPLPPRKQLAISRLGFGHYNKCALSFPYTFWMNNHDDFIGVIDSPVAGRNILVMNISVLHHHNQVPVLIFVFGGIYAHQIETLTDATIVHECMDVLQRVLHTKNYNHNKTNNQYKYDNHYRNNNTNKKNDDIPQPIDYVVTRWSNDRYSRGAFSYIPPGVDGFQELTIMSEPIYAPPPENNNNPSKTTSNDSQKNCSMCSSTDHAKISNNHSNGKHHFIRTRSRIKKIIKEVEEEERNLHRLQLQLQQQQKAPLIMFAGEATTPFHPSTIHGAYLSGIREAYRLDLCLEPKLNNFVKFEKTSLYRRTFSVKRCLPVPPPGSYANLLQSKQQSYYSTKIVTTKSSPKNNSKYNNKTNITPIHVKERRSNRKPRPTTTTTTTSLMNYVLSSPIMDHSNNYLVHDKQKNERQRQNNKLEVPEKNSITLVVRKSKRSLSTKKRIFYGDLDGDNDQSSSDSESNTTENNSYPQNLDQENELSSTDEEDDFECYENSFGFTNADDLALLRGVDTFGSDWKGMKNIKSKLFPTYYHQHEITTSLNAKNELHSDAKKKTIQNLKGRYNDLVEKMKADYNISISNGSTIHKPGTDKKLMYEEAKKRWILPDGSGCWLAGLEDEIEQRSKPKKEARDIVTSDELPIRKSGRKRTPKMMFDI